METIEHTLSVVIAHDTKRGEQTLNNCIASIKQECNAEIIIRTDNNLSAARNRGVEQSKGNIILFFDDDVVLRRGCIQELTCHFKDPKVGIVGGVNIAFPNISPQESIAASIMSSPIAMFRSAARYTQRGNIRDTDEAEILSCVMAVRKKAFIEAQGFPEHIIPCEENVLINRVKKRGYRVLYNPFAIVYHRRPRVFREYWKTIFEYGKGRGIMMKNNEGTPKMMWQPNKRWLYYIIALAGHYISYLSGVAYGWLKS